MDLRAGIVAQKQLEALKADFYSMVTHDLRNPTGAIILSLDILLNGTLGPLAPKQEQFLSIAQNASKKLPALINDYLDYAKIDSGYLRLDKSDTELRGIMEETVKLAALQAEAKNQTLTVELPAAPLSAHVDGQRLQQVVENLLSNAIKYTPEGGAITLQLQPGRDEATIAVSDTGTGIAKDQLPALFSKYYRVPGKAIKGIVGTGLGLTIVKEIVEAHGGSVRAESDDVPGKGTRFTVRIPLEGEQKG